MHISTSICISVLAAITCILACPVELHAAHPLITEDTGTQGQGRFQLELTSERGYRKQGNTKETGIATTATLSYGLVESVDAIVNIPHLRNKTVDPSGSTTQAGHADTGFDVKWRFHQTERLSLALKTGFTIPNGDETQGLGAGEAGYSVYFVATLDPPPWTFNFHVGRVENRNTRGDREGLWHASVGGWRQLGDKTKVVFDVGAITNADPTAARELGFFIVGLIYSFTDNLDLDLGIKTGVTDPEVDYAVLTGLAFRF